MMTYTGTQLQKDGQKGIIVKNKRLENEQENKT